MTTDILKQTKREADRLARRTFPHDVRYASYIVNARTGRFLSFSAAVFAPENSLAICWEITCIFHVYEGKPVFGLFRAGRDTGIRPGSVQEAIGAMDAYREEYMNTGYRKLARRAMVTKRARALRAINALPG